MPVGEEQARETTGQEARLRELAVERGVRYEVRPEMRLEGDTLVRVGFDLQLYGLHGHHEDPIPGCPECQQVYATLREIARWSLPPDQDTCRFEIEGFDATLEVAPDQKDLDEVRLAVVITHRHDYFAPVDQNEERCLRELKDALGRLGIREGTRRAGSA